jgi:hypothetical protein
MLDNNSDSAEKAYKYIKAKRKTKPIEDRRVPYSISIPSSLKEEFIKTCNYSGERHGDVVEGFLYDYIRENGLDILIIKKRQHIADENAILARMEKEKAERGSIADKAIAEHIISGIQKAPFVTVNKDGHNEMIDTGQPITYKAFCGIINRAEDKFRRDKLELLGIAQKAINNLSDEDTKAIITSHIEQYTQRIMEAEQNNTEPTQEQAIKTPIMPTDEKENGSQ